MEHLRRDCLRYLSAGREDSRDGANRAIQLGSDRANALASGAQQEDGRGVYLRAWPADFLSFSSGVSNSSFHALYDHAALQLGDGAQNGEDHLASGGASVYVLGERDKINP